MLRQIVDPFLYEGSGEGRETTLHRRLLFLRFVERIEVYVWPPGAEQMSLLASATALPAASPPDASSAARLREDRGAQLRHVKERLAEAPPSGRATRSSHSSS